MTRLRSLTSRASFGVPGPMRSLTSEASSGVPGTRWPVVLLAVIFLALHLPYLPSSLEDLDSINFALGLRRFDVAHHQPHPPGYPLFIVMAKAVHAMVPSEEKALALVSVIGGAFGVLAIAALFRRIDPPGTPSRWSIAAVALAMTTPLYWFTASRPLSDSSGFAAALAVQAMTLAAQSTRGLATAAFCAGVAAGIRSQVVWLTVPLLIFQGLRAQGSRLEHGGTPALSPQPLALSLILFLAGILLWFIPLVAVSGGPAAYWHALFDQGAEDFGNIQMLWTRHGARDLVDAIYYAFAAPWAAWPVAVVALTSVCLGILRLARRQRSTLILLAVAFLPYLAFDLLFQETFTSRYALPLVVPMAYLAIAGLRAVPWDVGLAVAAALVSYSAHVGGTSIAAYSRAAAPAFRLLQAMRFVEGSDGVAPVLAMDRRESLDLRRPIKWLDSAMPRLAAVLPAPPQHEWLEAVKSWNSGARAPVWFVVDPLRASIDLIQHGEPERFRWPVPYPVLLGGVRPGEMDWYRVERPDWYVGEGWALTPEAAGVADADHRGPSLAPAEAWLHRRTLARPMLIGGRNLASSPARLTLQLAGGLVDDTAVPPGFFVRIVPLPADAVDSSGSGDYVRLTVTASAGSRVAIEQFDASAERPLVGYGNGWQEPEFDPRTGRRWRWLSERAELACVPNRSPGTNEPLVLHLEGESSLRYFSRASILTILSGDRQLLATPIRDDFSIDVPFDGGPLVLQTDQVFSPADRGWRRSADRRHLGLRIFKAEIRKAIRPAS